MKAGTEAILNSLAFVASPISAVHSSEGGDVGQRHRLGEQEQRQDEHQQHQEEQQQQQQEAQQQQGHGGGSAVV